MILIDNDYNKRIILSKFNKLEELSVFGIGFKFCECYNIELKDKIDEFCT